MKVRLGLLIISLKSFSLVYHYELTYMIKIIIIIIIDSKILQQFLAVHTHPMRRCFASCWSLK